MKALSLLRKKDRLLARHKKEFLIFSIKLFMNEKMKKVVLKIEKNNILYRVIDVGKTMISSKDVENIGENPEEIFKTIVMINNKGNFFAAVLNGRKMVDLEKVKKVMHSGQL